MKLLLKILTIFVAVGAVGGAVMMWMDPSGMSWGGEPMLDLLRAKMPWPDVFFKDFIPSGFVLLAVNGLPQILAALMLFKNHRLAYWTCLACGIIPGVITVVYILTNLVNDFLREAGKGVLCSRMSVAV